MMELENSSNLNSLSHYDLNTKFIDRCHMDWSATNLISVVTLEGIYILEPNLERPHGPYKIELIRNLTDRFTHESDMNGDSKIRSFNEMLPTLSNKQYMDIFLDSALSTNIGSPSATGKTNEPLLQRKFRTARWSPIIDIYPRECILGAITVDYQLVIYGRRHGIWVILANLSRDYDRVWNIMSHDNGHQAKDFESIRKSLHGLSFCNLCWDNRGSGQMRTHLNLIATTLLGDIVIWQVNFNSQKPNGIQIFFNEIVADIKMVIKTQQESITCMQLHRGLLIASSQNGQVVLYDLNTNLENIDGSSKHDYSLSTRRQSTSRQSRQMATKKKINCFPVIELPPTAILWHQDNVEVMDFYMQAMGEETSRIVLAKSTNICWCMIQYIERSATNPATLIIGDSFSAIDGLDPEISLHQTPAIWLRPANNKRAVLIAEDGSFLLLNFFDDSQDVSPSFNTITTGKIDLADMVPKGVCTSPNGYLISMISSVTFLFDPIKLPSPSKLITLPVQNDGQLLPACLEQLLDESWLQARGVKSPMDVCDLIDYLRSLFPSFNQKQCDKLYNWLSNNLHDLGEPKTEIQIVKLKIIGFIELKLTNYCNSGPKLYDDVINDEQSDAKKSIYSMILYREIENVIYNLTRESRITFTNDQLNSLHNYLNWMSRDCNAGVGQFHSSRCSIRDRLKLYLNKIRGTGMNQDIHEICSICGSKIPFESAYYSQCTNQHRFVRCSRSLLTIDLGKDTELECEHCKRHYIIDRIWLTPNLWSCLYCH